MTEESIIVKTGVAVKVKDFMMLMKLRLSLLVVISAITGYFFGGGAFDERLVYLICGGFLVTGASNAMNQIWERNLDKLMKRTEDRPLAANRMGVPEALIFSVLIGVAGALLLFKLNNLAGILGVSALISYVFIYTPMKQISPWAVFVVAFPGAIPPLLGIVAVTGDFNLAVGIIFLFQFMWQFPHFWAIAWVSHDDYQRAGFYLLPSRSGKSKHTAFLIVLYTLMTVIAGLLPWYFEFTGVISLVVGSIAGLWFYWKSFKLYNTLSDKAARSLMFASFIYLPIMQFLYVFDKI